MNLMHIQTEQRYWTNIVRPLAEKHLLKWDVQADFEKDTVVIKLIHPNDIPNIQKHPEFVRRIDADRAHRSEKIILNEIEKTIAGLLDGK